MGANAIAGNLRLRLALGLSAALFGSACGTDDLIRGVLVPSQSKLDFGEVSVGDRATQRFEIRLTRGPPRQIASIEADGAWSARYQFQLSRVTVARGAPVTVTVRYTPDAPGVHDGDLRVEAVGVGFSQPVRIRGEGVRDEINFDRDVLPFEPVVLGSEGWQTIRLRNLGSRAVDIAMEATADVGACDEGVPFCVVDFPSRIPAGSFVEINVRFRPVRQGQHEAVFRLSACDALACKAEVQLVADGVREGLTCEPSAVDFGPVGIGDCQESTVQCAVLGNLKVDFLGAETSDPSAFFAQAGRPVTLSQGARLELPTRFCPSVRQAYRGELVLHSRTSMRALRKDRVRLVGVGGAPRVQVTPASLDFGDVAVGLTARRSMRVTNDGAQPLAIERIEVDTDQTGTLSSLNAAPVVIAPGADVRWDFEVRPVQGGRIATGLRLETSDRHRPTVVIPVLAQAVVLPACDYWVPSQVGFGAVVRGQVAVRTVMLENRGATDCILGPVQLEDTSGTYRVVRAPPSGRLPPGVWPIQVAYAPEREVASNARLRWSISNPDRPEVAVDLDGRGSDDALLLGPQSVDLTGRAVGCASGARTIGVWNTGPEDVTVVEASSPMGAPAGVSVEAVSLPLTLRPGQRFALTIADSAQSTGRDAGAVWIESTRDGQTLQQVIDVHREVGAALMRVDEFEQRPRGKVDVVLVVDHTLAMQQERPNIEQAVGEWIESAATAGLDYRFAVTTTDVLAEGGAMLVPAGATDRTVDANSQPTPVDALTERLRMRPLSPARAGSVDALASLEAMLSPTVRYGVNAGAFRPDAHLSIVLIAQQDDASGIDLERIIARLRGLRAPDRRLDVSVHAVSGDPVLGCSGVNGTAEPAPRLASLVGLFQGERASVCTTDWNDAFRRMSDGLLGTRARFRLSDVPDATALVVLVDGVAVPPVDATGTLQWSYDRNARAIQFARAPVPGARIIVRYAAQCE